MSPANNNTHNDEDDEENSQNYDGSVGHQDEFDDDDDDDDDDHYRSDANHNDENNASEEFVDGDVNPHNGNGALIVGQTTETDANTAPTAEVEEDEEDEDDDEEEEAKHEEGFVDEDPLVSPDDKRGDTNEADAEQPKNVADDPMIKPLIMFIVVAVIISVILFPILFLVVLPKKLDEDKNNNQNNNNAASPAPSTAAPTIAWLWDIPEEWKSLIEQDPTSTMAQAYNWVGNDPQLNDYDQDRRLQRFALAGLYYATGGESWTRATAENWLTYDISECEWGGLSCDENSDGGDDGNIFQQNVVVRRNLLRRKLQTDADTTAGGTGDAQNDIQSVALPSSNLRGSIPLELSLLTKLKRIDFSDNSLTQDIPAKIFESLAGLTSLDMKNNQLEETVSPLIGNLTNLTSLDLSGNGFEGEIPSEVGKLKNLQLLNLFNNSFGSTIPTQLGNLYLVRSLDASNNALIGTIPVHFGALTLLSHLAIHHNSMTGTLPSIMGMELQRLLLNNNNFKGNIPLWDRLAKLELLDVSENPLLDGKIPGGLCDAIKFTCVKKPNRTNLCGCDCACFVNPVFTGIVGSDGITTPPTNATVTIDETLEDGLIDSLNTTNATTSTVDEQIDNAGGNHTTNLNDSGNGTAVVDASDHSSGVSNETYPIVTNGTDLGGGVNTTGAL